MSSELRQHDRQETGYAIRVRPIDIKQPGDTASITNLSQGGLCFVSTLELLYGDNVEIDMPAIRPAAVLKAKVVWCRPQRDLFSVGVEFVGLSASRRARIFEMHRAINAYRQMNNPSGDVQLATVEWLSLYAEKFLADSP